MWECLEAGKVLCRVVSEPLPVDPATWHCVGVSWGGGLRLHFDGKTVAEEPAVPLPSMMSKVFFVGSDSQGRGTLDGWIDRVEIMLFNALPDGRTMAMGVDR